MNEKERVTLAEAIGRELTEEEQRQLSGQVEVLLRKGLFTEQELLDDLGKSLSRIEPH